MISFLHTLANTTASAKPHVIEDILSSGLMLPVLMVVMFYFLLIRPQQRQRKEQAARVAALKSGDKVITTAGLHGLVHNVKEATVVIKVAEGTMLEFDKAAIATVTKKEAKEA